MFLIGLTGGIGAGKSTVAARWCELGGIEIDADQLAREVVAPGTDGALKISEVFGADFFDSNGFLDRKKLAERIFSNSQEKEALEDIIHPLVRDLALKKISQLPSESMAIYTVPLLVEANVTLPFDAVVTVEAPEDVRVQRLVETRGFSEVEARARIANQAQPIERASRADYILNSNQSLPELIRDADELWAVLTKKANQK
ncbi:MAG: dephospho-CoA kinase [Microbacteriaceae bacterium]|nr:dephospho-CoA kinase [Microbacteriaceae bacterium]